MYRAQDGHKSITMTTLYLQTYGLTLYDIPVGEKCRKDESEVPATSVCNNVYIIQ